MAHSIPEEIIQRIKNAANIVDVVADSVVLRKSGRNHLGLCPFHAEKTPSFTVSEEKQIYYCFGCHTGGNVFSFLMQHEGVPFPEAVRAVAAKYGIQVPDDQLSPSQKQKLTERDRLLQINEAAKAFYSKMLNDPRTGQKAMAYLLGRGMTRKIIEGFCLGYAPDRWDALLTRAQNKEVPVERLVKSGLVIPRQSQNGHYDRFRDRVMFPIFNLSQQVIGFGGRVMGDQLPKYLNSPETPVYTKGSSLYGIHKARHPARSAGKVYLVEGYFDVLALHLYGIENSVATLGTALTAEHAQVLKGMLGPSGQVVLVYDSDQAGIQAARRSISIFEEGLLDARILVLPQGYDPDQYLREHGPDAFFKAADNASGMIPFLIDSAVEQFGLSLEGKVKVVGALQDVLASVRDSVARTLYIQQLAERLNIDQAAILEKIRSAVPSSSTRVTAPPAGAIGLWADGQRLELRILAVIMHFPEMIPDIIERKVLDKFEDDYLKNIAQKMVSRASAENMNIAGLVSDIDDPRYRNLVTQMAMSDEHWDRLGCERLLTQLETRYERRTNANLQHRIIDAEKNNDIDLLCKLLRQKQMQAAKGLIH